MDQIPCAPCTLAICFEKIATAGPYNVHVCEVLIVLSVLWAKDGQDPIGQNIGQSIEMTPPGRIHCENQSEHTLPL